MMEGFFCSKIGYTNGVIDFSYVEFHPPVQSPVDIMKHSEIILSLNDHMIKERTILDQSKLDCKMPH